MTTPTAPQGWYFINQVHQRACALRSRAGVLGLSLAAAFTLAVASWTYILMDGSGFGDLFTARTWADVSDFLGQMLGVDSGRSADFRDLDRWVHGGKLAFETLAMRVLAIGLAGAAAFLTFVPAARNIARGDLAPRGSASWGLRAAYTVLRATFILTRGVPELIWAMIIVFFLSPGLLPGALALAAHNYGILGKLSAELV